LLPSILNCTAPVGVAAPGAAATVPEKDTDCPTLEGLRDDATDVVVVAGLTV
jgi:hypothetical protein